MFSPESINSPIFILGIFRIFFLNKKFCSNNLKTNQKKADTKDYGAVITAEIKYNNSENIKYEIVNTVDTKFELKFSLEKNGIYHVYIFLNGKPIKGILIFFINYTKNLKFLI